MRRAIVRWLVGIKAIQDPDPDTGFSFDDETK
jgi:hypothetical protein